MQKGVKAMWHSIVRYFRSPCSGDDAAYADGLYLPPWVCDPGLSRHADRLARSASPHLLLAGVHASRAPGATYLGRDGPVDASEHHRVALWPSAQSRLLERASARPLVGAASAPLPLARVSAGGDGHLKGEHWGSLSFLR